MTPLLPALGQNVPALESCLLPFLAPRVFFPRSTASPRAQSLPLRTRSIPSRNTPRICPNTSFVRSFSTSTVKNATAEAKLDEGISLSSTAKRLHKNAGNDEDVKSVKIRKFPFESQDRERKSQPHAPTEGSVMDLSNEKLKLPTHKQLRPLACNPFTDTTSEASSSSYTYHRSSQTSTSKRERPSNPRKEYKNSRDWDDFNGLMVWIRLRSLPSGIEEYDTRWIGTFQKLNAAFDPMVKDPLFFYPDMTENGRQLAQQLASFSKSEDLKAYWDKFQGELGWSEWREAMLYLLFKNPEQARIMLNGTLHSAYIPSYALNDCVEFLIHYHLGSKPYTNQGPAGLILASIRNLKKEQGNDVLRFHERPLRLLMQNLTPKDTHEFYQILTSVEHPLSVKTLEIFAARLANYGYTRTVLDIFGRLSRDFPGWDINSEKPHRVSWMLLFSGHEGPSDQYMTDAEIFSTLLEYGLAGSVDIYGILLHNACIRDASDSGWDIYNSMISSGVQPDGYIYNTLLRYSVSARQKANFAAVTRLAVKHRAVNQHYVASLLLGTLALAPSSIRPGQKFMQLCEIYTKFFNVQPLNEIFPPTVQLTDGERTPNDLHLGDPDHVILIIMVGALLQTLRDYEAVAGFYRHIQTAWAQGNQNAAHILKTNFVSNYFIRKLGRRLETIHLCPEIIRDMLRRYSSTVPASASKQTTSLNIGESLSEVDQFGEAFEQRQALKKSFRFAEMTKLGKLKARPYPAPDVKTFSILLISYLRLGQITAAQAVLRLMEERQVKPNIVTYNSLARGYLWANDMSAIAQVLDTMDAHGIDPDDYTMAVLRNVDNIEALKKALESHRAARRLPVSEDITQPVAVSQTVDEFQLVPNVESQRITKKAAEHLVKQVKRTLKGKSLQNHDHVDDNKFPYEDQL